MQKGKRYHYQKNFHPLFDALYEEVRIPFSLILFTLIQCLKLTFQNNILDWLFPELNRRQAHGPHGPGGTPVGSVAHSATSPSIGTTPARVSSKTNQFQ